MGPEAQNGAELLKKYGIEAYSTIYKFSLIILIVLCVYLYKKYKVGEEIDDCFASYHLTWMSLGMTIVSFFCFMGSDTDPYAELYLIYIAAFMCPYYLYNQYDIANKKSMKLKYWIQSYLLGLVDLFFIIMISKEIVLLIILVQTMFLILYESKAIKKQYFFNKK